MRRRQQQQQQQQQEQRAPPPHVVVSKQLIGALLTQDAVHRRASRWPLLGPTQLQRLPVNKTYTRDCLVSGQQSRYYGNYDKLIACNPLDCEHIESKLVASFPLLPRIMQLAEGRLIVAGGAVVNALVSNVSSCDCDLFFVGVSESEIMPLLTRIMTAFDGIADAVFFRSNHCVTVQFDKQVYQFIQRLYPYPDQVIGGFDIAAAGVAWSPETGLIATPLSAFCLTLRIVIADVSRRSPTFELRLVKYFHKGFQIVFPSVNPPQWGTLSFGIMEASENGVYLRRKHGGDTDAGATDSDYGFGKELLDPPTQAKKYLLYRNIVLAGKGKLSYVTLSAPSFAKLLNEPSVGAVSELRSIFEERAFRTVGFNLQMLCRYERWYGPDFDAFLLAKVDGRMDEAWKITERVIARVMAVFDEAVKASSKGLEWITKNPGAQWTSSFHPIRDTASSYFGKAHSPLTIGLPPNIAVEMSRLRLFHSGFARFPKNLFERFVLQYLYPMHYVPLLIESGLQTLLEN